MKEQWEPVVLHLCDGSGGNVNAVHICVKGDGKAGRGCDALMMHYERAPKKETASRSSLQLMHTG